MHVEQLVLRRVMQWEEQAKRTPRLGGVAQQPVITISRNCGAHGHEVGQRVAQRLGLNLYDRELVEQIAEHAQVREKVVESLDDRLRDRISNWVGEQFESCYFSYSDYLRNLSRVVLTIAEQERAVIVGRGAHLMLQPERTLRVRIQAPLELRIERLVTERGLSEREARAEVLRVDAERAAFVRRHFAQDVALSDHYDLLLNTAALDDDLCADLVAEAFRRRFGS
ncbi:MAG: cytidylate kinase-like family protein [Proteobacteria bacterium]|nr:cytidylate kinase-like family protein [Pseudomonadota bacterium]